MSRQRILTLTSQMGGPSEAADLQFYTKQHFCLKFPMIIFIKKSYISLMKMSCGVIPLSLSNLTGENFVSCSRFTVLVCKNINYCFLSFEITSCLVSIFCFKIVTVKLMHVFFEHFVAYKR